MNSYQQENKLGTEKYSFCTQQVIFIFVFFFVTYGISKILFLVLVHLEYIGISKVTFTCPQISISKIFKKLHK